MSGQKKAKAIYAYQGERPSDLSFQAGDIITVISEQSPSGPEWWEGELFGRRGAFPLNHVEVLLPNKKGVFDTGVSAPGGLQEPKIGKPAKPDLFQPDHIAWKVSLIFSIVATIAMLIALIMPWYFIASPNVAIQEFQFLGIKQYQKDQLNNPRAVITSTSGDYKTYDGDKQPKTKQLHLISLILVLVAYFLQFFITILIFIRMRGYLKRVWYLPVMNLISFIFILIAPINYAVSITGVVADEIITPVPQDLDSFGGPRVAFFGTRMTQQYVVDGTIFGNAGTQTWGPTASWAFAIIAILPSFASYMTLFLVVLGRFWTRCGLRMKGGE
jgi:hypothetical protein